MTISAATRELVRERAEFLCEYCQTAEETSGFALEIDHIVPRAHGGSDEAQNLCLACSACNRYKQAKVEASDPVSKRMTSLFNPRTQQWADHFVWSDDGLRVEGLTECGRGTVQALRMNNRLIVSARAIWQQVGRHPP